MIIILMFKVILHCIPCLVHVHVHVVFTLLQTPTLSKYGSSYVNDFHIHVFGTTHWYTSIVLVIPLFL